MSETLVEDGTTYPGSITVPEDGDARNAASVVVGMQGLANRFAHWKSKFANALLLGGVIDILSTLTYTIAAATDIFFAGDGHVKFTCTSVLFDRNVTGPIIDGGGGSSGRVPKKLYIAMPSAGFTLNPALYDTAQLTPTTNLALTIAAGTYVTGDHLRVINKATSAFVSVKDPAGTLLTSTALANAHGFGEVEVWYDGAAWIVLSRHEPYIDT